MKISNERADISTGYEMFGLSIPSDEIINEFVHAWIPVDFVALVDAYNLTIFRNLNAVMREEKFAYRRIECEAMNAVTCGVNKQNRNRLIYPLGASPWFSQTSTTCYTIEM